MSSSMWSISAWDLKRRQKRHLEKHGKKKYSNIRFQVGRTKYGKIIEIYENEKYRFIFGLYHLRSTQIMSGGLDRPIPKWDKISASSSRSKLLRIKNLFWKVHETPVKETETFIRTAQKDSHDWPKFSTHCHFASLFYVVDNFLRPSC